MIFELRTYSFFPADMPKYLEYAGDVGRLVRGNDYGVNCGYWTSEFGRLNQVWHLWQYESYAQRDELRAKLLRNKDWVDGYLPVVQEWVRRMDIRIMNPHTPFVPPQDAGNVYEYRYYRCAVGEVGNWIGHFKEALPNRERYSKIVGLWQTELGQPDEVSHLWVYPDLNARADARARLGRDENWREFQSRGRPFLRELNNVLLQPTNFSPLK